jgi:protein-disulfide isomerase
MTQTRRLFAAFAALVAILFAVPVQAETQRAEIEAVVKDYLASQPEELQHIVRDYLLKHPEILRDALTELVTKRAPAAPRVAPASPEQKAAIRSNAEPLFNSPHQVVLGNRDGRVTLVEFFDYNCGYCRRALSDTLTLLQDDRDLRIVLKEFPILGPASTEAAAVAVAVRMQDPTGAKYLAFHRQLLGGRSQADRASALAAAREAGLDMARLERDLSGDEVRQTLAESVTLARALGINGTPGYVIGDAVIPGAIGAAGLKDKIAAERSR